MVSYKRRPPGTIKEATDQLIDAAGGQKKVADLFNWKRQYLFAYTNDDGEDARLTMPVGLARLIETHVGDPILTRFLAAEQGWLMLPLPKAAGGGQAGLDCAAIARRFGELMEEYGKALDPKGSGGASVTPAEAGRLVAEMHDLLEALAGPLAMMSALRDGGDRP
jgi:hypothetical protein